MLRIRSGQLQDYNSSYKKSILSVASHPRLEAMPGLGSSTAIDADASAATEWRHEAQQGASEHLYILNQDYVYETTERYAIQTEILPAEPSPSTSLDIRQQLHISPEGDTPWKGHKLIVIGCKCCSKRLIKPERCQDRTCGTCRKKDYYRLLDKYQPFVEQMPKNRLRLITLTLKNSPDLEERRQLLKDSISKLRRQQRYKDVFSGGIIVEEHVNKGNDWHCHLHCIVEGSYIDQKELSADWALLTDSPIVDIRAIKDPIQVLRYILKYLTKSPEIDTQAHRDEYNTVLKGKRLVQPFGSWYGKIKVEKKLYRCDDCGLSAWRIEWDLIPLVQHWFESIQKQGP